MAPWQDTSGFEHTRRSHVCYENDGSVSRWLGRIYPEVWRKRLQMACVSARAKFHAHQMKAEISSHRLPPCFVRRDGLPRSRIFCLEVRAVQSEITRRG